MKSLLPIVLATGALLTGYMLFRPVRAEAPTPWVAWIETQGGENLLLAAPVEDTSAPQRLVILPGGEILHSALSPDGQTLALVSASENGEILWLVGLSTGSRRQVAQAIAFDAPVWAADGTGLFYTLYQTGQSTQPGKDAFHQVDAPLPISRWFSPQGLPPTPQARLQGQGDTLVWVSPAGKTYPLARAQRGLSALWDATQGRVLLTRLAGGHSVLERLDPLGGAVERLATLPAGDWRILGQQGDWAVAAWYPHGVQIISLAQGNLRALGETRQFVGLLPPIGNSNPQRVRFVSRPSASGTPQVTLSSPTASTSPTSIPTQTGTVTLMPTSSPTLTPTSTPTPTLLPTCEPAPNGCPMPRYNGYQPPRASMGTLFVQAAENRLGSAAPASLGIYNGRPPVAVTPSAQRPLPATILRGIAIQESAWLQFSNGHSPWDDTNACTLVSFDCGYGLMQVTSCMSGGCSWMTPERAAAELPYNLGAGRNIFILKWNSVPYLGNNDFTDPALWYYATLAYNGWSTLNDPNNTNRFDPRRPPFRESTLAYAYPYQERVYGWLAHPYHVGGQELWRPTHYAQVPRGIFGLRAPDSWTPPSETTRPLVHLFHNLTFSPTHPLTLTIQNTTPYTLAADLLFYHADGSFDRRYLLPSADPPWFVSPYLRIAPSSTLTLPFSSVFFTETFTGTLRAYASEGLTLSLETSPSPPPYVVYLPLMMKGNAPGLTANPKGVCEPLESNGDFEVFRDGRPLGWEAFSEGGYTLADSTWFRHGHFGGYLGGYNAAHDVLSQTWRIPPNTLTVTLSLAWDVTNAAPADALPGDVLTVTLVDTAGQPLGTPWTVSNVDAPGGWALTNIQWPVTNTLSATLRLEARTDANAPTAFFVDDIHAQACGVR